MGMARNYVEFYSSRVNSGGNYVSFIRQRRQDVIDACNIYVQTFGGSIDWNGRRGYFLVDARNITGLLETFCNHYSSYLGSAWSWNQQPETNPPSPRGKGRKKWSQIIS